MSDEETGFMTVPPRYLGDDGREKIDEIRDAMSDAEFAAYCLGNAMKYNDRNKGQADPEKRRWYLEMRNHVLIGGEKHPDPRHNRPGFQPYKRGQLPNPIPRRRIDVLDHGFVRLVESWGHGDARMSEAGIIEAARQSTQGAFRGWKRDQRLLRFLHEHKHSTPFEFAGMVLEVKAPIFIFRQWHRHRTFCLHPDTLVWFERPDNGRPYPMRIEDVWRKWQPTERAERPERQTNALWPRQRLQSMRLRCLNEETGEFVTTEVVDVIKGEAKPMVTVTTDRFTLTATLAHRVFTDKGWLTLGDAIEQDAKLAQCGTDRNLAEPKPPSHYGDAKWKPVVGWEDYYEVSSHGDVRRIGGSPKKLTRAANGYFVCSLNRPGKQATALVHRLVAEAFLSMVRRDGQDVVRHRDHNPLNNNAQNLQWGTAADNVQDTIDADRFQKLSARFSAITSVTDAGEHVSYDISVRGPWHNFVAEGIVVHNSYNEMSARYAPVPDEHYVPTVERLITGSEGNANKQAARGEDAPLLDEVGARIFIDNLLTDYADSEGDYQDALRSGVPKELARLHHNVGRYSQMRATGVLRNWLAFLTLRMDPHAQWEIQEYARAVYQLVVEEFPRTAALWAETTELADPPELG